ncbi:MAG: glycosyltransferase [Puniceicoccaceae bacterium]
MNILFFSNTYLPHVGGVAKSVHTLENSFREKGHQVRIVAPEFEGAEPDRNVLRVPAIQNFNGSDFSVRIPIPNAIWDFVEDFGADIVHSHHPFLLGDAALRVARRLQVPILFTHHTLYERYTHYVPFDSPAMKRMAIALSVEYCNLCDRVIAPSRSIADLLEKRGVETPVEAIPTGIDCDAFACADGAGFREAKGISAGARVIGTVGRLAEEKNLLYLAEAVAAYLREHSDTVFLVVGEGDAAKDMLEILGKDVPHEQIRMQGKLSGRELHDAYAAMDCFVFASQTETQGLVLAEALAAGKPVVALDGPGVREVVADGRNGTLLPSDAPPARFTENLEALFGDEETLRAYSRAARESIEEYDTEVCAAKMLDCYRGTIAEHASDGASEPPDYWRRILAELETEWDLAAAKTAAIRAGFRRTGQTEESQLD